MMEIRETIWEQRNLGVPSSVEFFVSSEQCPREFIPIWEDSHSYQVLNIDTGNTSALLNAQEHGFRLIEMKIKLQRLLGDVSIPAIYKRWEHVLDFHTADEAEIEQILSIVRTGEMFLTDRVALDPRFGPKLAGRRYAFWARDILDKGGVAVVTTYKQIPIGFEIYIETDGKCVNIIGGVYPDHANKGLGFAPLYAELLDQSRRGNKSVTTNISSNNLPVFKLHELLGFRVDRMAYVLIRHV